MHTKVRRFSSAVLGISGVGLVAASVVWACTPEGYGWVPPAQPSEPPSSGSARSTPASPQPTPTQTPTGPSSVPQGSAPSGSSGQEPARGQQPARSPARGQSRAPVSSQQRATSSGPAGGRATQSAGSATGRSTSGTTSPTPAGVTSRSGRAFFADSLAPASAGSRGSAAAPAGFFAPSEQSATGDLWSGFAAGASLIPSVMDPSVSTSEADSTLPVGLGLLGLGAVALLGGLAVAEGRRRRALVLPRGEPGRWAS